jgi:hypothetical protein
MAGRRSLTVGLSKILSDEIESYSDQIVFSDQINFTFQLIHTRADGADADGSSARCQMWEETFTSAREGTYRLCSSVSLSKPGSDLSPSALTGRELNKSPAF